MVNVLVDTGQWYGQFDPNDEHHSQAQENATHLEKARNIVIPWPVLYETMRSAFVRKRNVLADFEAYIKGPRIVFADDLPYRDDALELALCSSLRRKRPLSLVDCTIRLMLEDVNMKIDCLMTFNARDFHDVCRARVIEMISA